MAAEAIRRSGRDVPRARGRVAALEALEPRGAALVGRAVVLGVAVVEVAGRGRGAQGLLDVALLDAPLAVHRVAPQAGHAVSLKLERLRAEARALRVEPELLLDVVGVLVRDDVREPEVADRVPVPRALAGEVVRDPTPQVRGEDDGHVHRVVGRAEEGRAVVGGDAAAGPEDVARLDPHVRHARLGPPGGRQRLRPVGIDALQHLEEVALDARRLRAPAARRRPGPRRRLGHRLAQVVEHLLHTLLEPLARLLGALAQIAHGVVRPAARQRATRREGHHQGEQQSAHGAPLPAAWRGLIGGRLGLGLGLGALRTLDVRGELALEGVPVDVVAAGAGAVARPAVVGAAATAAGPVAAGAAVVLVLAEAVAREAAEPQAPNDEPGP